VFDHVEINVSDMDVSRCFFEAALAPLGYEISVDSPELVDMQAAGRSIRARPP
jgi:catechol 2,3-dioxygenase-like lactoylglutathione lyase family enzyme